MSDKEELQRRAYELMKPVYQQIMMTDDREDLLLLALAMLNKSSELLDTHFSEEYRKEHFRLFV